MQNFMQIPPRGVSRQMGEVYAKIFIAIRIPFFHRLTYRSDPLADFLRAMAQTMRSRARMCLLGVKKFEINI